jgi:hypothetical protein
MEIQEGVFRRIRRELVGGQLRPRVIDQAYSNLLKTRDLSIPLYGREPGSRTRFYWLVKSGEIEEFEAICDV